LTIDELELEIRSNADKAVDGLDKLTAALGRVKAATHGGTGLEKYASAIERIKNATHDSTSGIGTLASAVERVTSATKGSTGGISKLATAVERIRNATQGSAGGIQELNSAVGDNANITQVSAGGLAQFASAVENVVHAANKSVALEAATQRIAKLNVEASHTSAATANIGAAFSQATNAATSVCTAFETAGNTMRNSMQQFSATGVDSAETIGGAHETAARRVSTAWRDGFKGIGSTALSAMKTAAKATSRLTASVLGLNNAFKKTNKSAGFFGTTLGKALKSIILYRILRRIVTNIANAFKEGIQNISHYSDAVQAAMSSIVTDTQYLKNSMGALAAPVVEALAPAFRVLTDAIVSATNALGMFLALLTGKGTFVKATRSAKEYGDAVSGAAKAQKEFTMGFDELNVISESMGGGGGSGDNFSDMFETVEIPDSLINIADKFKNIFDIEDMVFFEGLGSKLAGAIETQLNKIPWETIKTKTKTLATNIGSFLNGFLTDENMWSSVGRTIAEGLNTALTFVNTLLDTLDFASIGKAVANGINSFIDKFDWNLLGRTISNRLNSALTFANNLFKNTDFDKLGTSVGSGVNTAVQTFDWKKLGQTIANGINSVIDFTYGLVTKLDWKAIGTGISDTVNSFVATTDWKKLAQTISTGILGIISTVSTLLNSVKWRDIGKTIADMLFAIDWSGLLKGLGNVIGGAINASLGLINGIAEGTIKGIAEIFESDFSSSNVAYALGNFMQKVMSLLPGYDIAYGIGESLAIGIVDSYADVYGTRTYDEIIAERGRELAEEFIGPMREAGRTIEEQAAIVRKKYGDEAAKAFTEAAKQMERDAELLATSLEKIGTASENAVLPLQKSLRELELNGNAASKLADAYRNGIGDIETYTKRIESAAEAFDLNWEATEKLREKQGDYIKTVQDRLDLIKELDEIELGFADTQLAVLRAEDKVTEARIALAEATMKFGIESREVHIAELELESAMGKRKIAQEKLAKETQLLADGTKALTTAEGNELVAQQALQGELAITEGNVDKLNDVIETLSKDGSKNSIALRDQMIKDVKDMGLSWDEESGKLILSSGETTKTVGEKFSAMLLDIAFGAKNMSKSWEDESGNIITVGERMTSAIGEKFSSMLESVKRAFSTAWDGIKNLFSSDINTSVNVTTNTKSNSKKFAQGGFPTMGEMFIAREAGPELVGQIGNRTAVANNDQIVAAVSEGVYSAVYAAMSSRNDSDRPLDVNLYLDGRQLDVSLERVRSERGEDLFPGGFAFGLA